MNQEKSNNFIDSEDLNLGRFVRLILLQSKIIFTLTLVGLIIGISLYSLQEKTYKISSLLQIQAPNQNFDPRQSLILDFYNAPDTNIENLMRLYSSRTNMLDLINDLNLNLQILNLDDSEILNINSFNLKTGEGFSKKTFYLQIQDNSFTLLDDQSNFLLQGENGKYIENENYQVKLNFSNLNSKKLYEISFRNPSELHNKYKNKLKVKILASRANYWSQEGLLEVFLTTGDIYQGMKILNKANEIFINDSIKVETEKARSSIVFIDSQLKSLDEILNLRKKELKNFKQENRSLNVNLEVESIISLIAEIEQKINKVDLEISQAEINFTEDNPLYLNLKIQKEALEVQKDNIQQKIENLPTAQQEYIDLYRNLEISEELYSQLVNRKLNFSLIEASSIGNIRIVDQAYVEGLVGPRLITIFIITVLFFIIGFVIAIIRGLFFISISNPAELKDAGININISGVIPHLFEIEKPFEEVKFEQAIETLILNLETIISSSDITNKTNKCRQVVITSPNPSNGKSVISRNLAEGLSQIGHKVLLMDIDLKRGNQHKFYDREVLELKDFKNISSENIENLKVKNNLYLLPRLKNLKNTFEHLYSDDFLNKINEFKNLFDYIVIDTAPVLAVSDTGLLMTTSDINFLVVRHQSTRINEVKQASQIMDQIGRSFDGLIYNDYQRPKGYYGYYDLYGDYSYRYYADRYLYDDYYVKKDD